MEIKAPQLAFADRGQDGAMVLSGVGQLLSFCLIMLAFPGFLARKSRPFLELFWSPLGGISGFLAPPAPNPGYMKQKENPVNSPPCQSLSPNACLFLTTFQSLLIFVSCTTSKVLSYT